MSSKLLLKRLANELNDLDKNPVSNCSAGPVDSDMTHWKATIFGPEGTPYYEGIFELDIKFTNEYPFKPPQIYFITPIYHCNISTSGNICLDILKNNWNSALTISKVLLSICSLLTEPNFNDPLVNEISNLYKANPKEYENTAKTWTQIYAT